MIVAVHAHIFAHMFERWEATALPRRATVSTTQVAAVGWPLRGLRAPLDVNRPVMDLNSAAGQGRPAQTAKPQAVGAGRASSPECQLAVILLLAQACPVHVLGQLSPVRVKQSQQVNVGFSSQRRGSWDPGAALGG